jgi:hypothetical protein
MKLLEKQKRSRTSLWVAAVALTFALVATCSLALLTYLILPSSFSSPLFTLSNLTPREIHNRRMQQLPASTVPQISLFSSSSSNNKNSFHHQKSFAILPNAAGDYEHSEGYFTTLIYDFEAKRAPIPSVRPAFHSHVYNCC